MKVSVIGPGAMGCLFAAKLAISSAKTTLIDYKSDRAKALAEHGIVVESESGTTKAKPAVSLEIPPKQNLIVVLTKAHASAGLNLPGETPVLTLQNGLGNVETLCGLVGSANILAGTTSEACTSIKQGHVRHVSTGKTVVGSWTSCPTDDAIKILSEAGFDVELTDTPGQSLWEKVAVSAAINPLTAILNVPNGALLKNPEIRQLMRDLVVEASKVASTEGYRFDHSLVEYAERVCRDTKDNISSMLQDVRAGRQTEIESISGEILRRGESASLPAPRTRVAWQLIKGLEQK